MLTSLSFDTIVDKKYGGIMFALAACGMRDVLVVAKGSKPGPQATPV